MTEDEAAGNAGLKAVESVLDTGKKQFKDIRKRGREGRFRVRSEGRATLSVRWRW